MDAGAAACAGVLVGAGAAEAAAIVAAAASPADAGVMLAAGALALGRVAGSGDRGAVFRALADGWGMTVLACRLGMLRASWSGRGRALRSILPLGSSVKVGSQTKCCGTM